MGTEQYQYTLHDTSTSDIGKSVLNFKFSAIWMCFYVLYLIIYSVLHSLFFQTRMKLYNTVALPVPVLLYGNETWTIKASDARRITAAEMKHMRRTAGYTWTD